MTGTLSYRARNPTNIGTPLLVYSSTRRFNLADWKNRSFREPNGAPLCGGGVESLFQLILLDGRPVGRIVVDRTDGEWHLVDIAVLPANAGAVESEPRLLAICCRPLTRPDKWWEHQSSPAMSMPVDSGCDWASSLP
jgi:hypothetical protein